jgi:hypothetical protein
MNRHEEGDLPKLVGSLTLMLPGLLFRFGIEAFRFKYKAYRAARVFRRELTRQGLDDITTHRLTAFYFEGSDPFKLIRALR